MATYKGNTIGTSKEKGILSKYSEEGSDLKLLQFGDFLKGSEPFITKDINTGEPFDRDTWVRMYLNNSSMAARKRIEDTARITKFVASPRGVLWEADMAALEAIQKSYNQKHQQKINSIQNLSNASTDAGDVDFWKSLGKNLFNTAVNFGKSALQGIGLTAATLTQVAASGTGFHNDTYISRAYLTDGSGVLNQILSYAGLTTGGGLNGAAAVLGGATNVLGEKPWERLPDEKKMVPDSEGRSGNGTRWRFPVQSYGTEKARPDYDYSQGLSGLAATPIQRLAQQNNDTKNYKGESIRTGYLNSYVTSSNVIKERELHGVTRQEEGSTVANPVLSDVVAADSQSLGNRYGEVVNRGARFDPDLTEWYLKQDSTGVAKKRDDPDYTYLGKPVTIGLSKNTRLSYDDHIAKYIYGNEALNFNVVTSSLKFDPNEVSRDLGLIPFCITTITPEHRTYLNFPAYLDSYEDNYTGDWDSVQYVGRAEKFYGYKGFTRSINLSFIVIAKNIGYLKPMYEKLNRLVGATAPSYQSGVFMRGTLASLTVGGVEEGALLKEQLGFIPSVKLSWETDVPWEINFSGEAEEATGTKFVVPHALKVSMTFTPIEKQEVREDYGGFFVFDGKEKTYTDAPQRPYISSPVEEESRGQVYPDGGGIGGGARGSNPADTVPRVVGGTTGASSTNQPSIWQLWKMAFDRKNGIGSGGGK